MGYYSDVAICCSNNFKNKLEEKIKETGIIPCTKIINLDDDHTAFVWLRIKWYNEEASEIESFIRKESENEEYDITFQRIGCDYDDYEDFSNTWNTSMDILHEFDLSSFEESNDIKKFKEKLIDTAIDFMMDKTAHYENIHDVRIKFAKLINSIK